MISNQFPGFPQEGLQFLADLKDNNDREWFKARKDVYKNSIVSPAVEFILAFGEGLIELVPNIIYDTRTNGSGSLMRIYRDVRFSKDKTPYKTYVGIIFWEGGGKKMENPGFYFGFDETGGGMHVGHWGFPKHFLAAYREAVANDNLGPELEAAIQKIESSGDYSINGDKYKRVPRGYDKDHPRADLLLYKGMYASSHGIATAQLTSPELVDICLQYSRDLAPLHRWMVKVNETAGSS